LSEPADAAPFPLAGASVGGDTEAAAELTRLVSARTGIDLAASPDGVIRLAIAAGGAAESYTLTVDAASIELTGADAAGLFYGVQSLAQLVTRDGGAWVVPALEVEDAPRFAYRGVMLDVARHFFGVDEVLALIDRAASLKCNHVHLHLTDDQGWRLQFRSRPELTARASSTGVGGDGGGFYTREDYTRIVDYAASRHITVVPEVDIPGHTHTVGLAYPEIAADPVLSDGVRAAAQEFGGGLPEPGRPYTGMAVGFSSLRIDDERTYEFLADVFGELAALTPGPYLHIGGDEALGTSAEDYATIVSRAVDLVAATGKIPIAWHEASAVADLPTDLVAQYWGFLRPERDVPPIGHADSVILSPADAMYLDMKPDDDFPLGLTWANGPTSVERAYSWEPEGLLPGVDAGDILGVEAPLWTETVRTLADIDALAFPRLAAAAEIAWSPAPTASPERTWWSFRERVAGLGPLWTAAGIGFSRSPEIPWREA
jgi:hexosaminidase